MSKVCNQFNRVCSTGDALYIDLFKFGPELCEKQTLAIIFQLPHTQSY